jgi:hypothetical protein
VNVLRSTLIVPCAAAAPEHCPSLKLFRVTSVVCLNRLPKLLSLGPNPIRAVNDHVHRHRRRARTLPSDLGQSLNSLHPNLGVLFRIHLLLPGGTLAPMRIGHERVTGLSLRFSRRPDAMFEKVVRVVLVLDLNEAFEIFAICTLDSVRMG